MAESARRTLLEPFLRPGSVAIIGLSRSAIGAPISILTTLTDLGYRGRIHIVNPGMASAPGAEICARVSDLPSGVELAIVSVERSRVPGTLEECVAAGIRAAVVITQGFADADSEGARLQKKIVSLCRRTGLRVIGPNTIGLTNLNVRFSSSFIEMGSESLPVGQVAQSGFLMMGHHLINNETAGFCQAIDLGNACDIGLTDVLEHFAEDDEVRAIECHIEAIDDGPAFMEAARHITRSKPMVVLKAGRTEAGRAAVASHTGNVAGQARIYDAAFRQAGVIQAESAEELRLLSKTFAVYGAARGKRVAVVSFSGGGAVLAVDATDRAGLELAPLSRQTAEAIGDLFPDWIGVHNPLDIWIPVSKDLHGAFPRILQAVLDDPNVDGVLCIYCSYTQPKYADFDVSEHIRRLSKANPEKPVLCWSYGQDIEGTTRRIEADGSCVVFPTLDGAARAMATLAEHGARHSALAPVFAEARRVDTTRVEALLRKAQDAGESYLFTDAMEILEVYGLPVVRWAHACGEGDLAERGLGLKPPFCLKIDSPDVLHKSDRGGVMLGIGGGAELAAAGRALKERVRAQLPNARLAGIVVQEMAAPGTELMMGMVRDATFGPCLVFGAGGVLAEVTDDFAFRIAPLTKADVHAMIGETAVAKVLDGARGRPPVDREALVETLLRLAQLACAHPEIREIDLNPVFARPDGATIVDVRMLLGQSEVAPAAPGSESAL